ncbi:hypothetical protein [uncultured Helicobacter sp.]|uniref:hypothetical protein n=1 Tax=uncultured Helicobacter sp. TaxID=175537 RepID=UPI0037532DE5
MQNKILINKIRNAAELAWAAYGYYDLIGKKFKNDNTYKGRENTEITQADILDLTYNKHIAVESNPHKPDDEIKVGKLDGDFSPLQAQRFFEKYELLDYFPKFDYKHNKQKQGFHACLFQNRESEQYIFAIRGSYDSRDYVEADAWNLLIKEQVPRAHHNKYT